MLRTFCKKMIRKLILVSGLFFALSSCQTRQSPELDIQSEKQPVSLADSPKIQARRNNCSDTKMHRMEISDTQSLHDSANHFVAFERNVFLQDPDFTLEADKLVIYLHEDQEESETVPTRTNEGRPPFRRFVATGPLVKIERIGADGEVQIAKCRFADYDAFSEDMVLKGGPPNLQIGESLISTEEGAKIILTKDGKYRIEAEVLIADPGRKNDQ